MSQQGCGTIRAGREIIETLLEESFIELQSAVFESIPVTRV
jgi:hypothetical protein